MNTIELNLSNDNLVTLDRYSNATIKGYEDGGMTKRELEEARSYAAEFLSRLLQDNPQVFNHAHFMNEIRIQRYGDVYGRDLPSCNPLAICAGG